MRHSVWIVGMLLCLWGIAVLAKPNWMRRVIDFLAVERRFWFVSAVRIIVGIVFLVSATGCRTPWMIVLVGILMVGSGLLAMVLKPEKVLKLIHWWQKQPVFVYYIWGIAAAVIGGIIFYAGLPK